MTNVLLVDDKKMSRDSIKGYLKNAAGRYTLSAETANAGKAELLCMQTPIDLVIMDVCTEGNEDGIEASAVLKRHFPKMKIVIVTGMTTSDLIERARAAGADSFWYKEAGELELIEVLDRTMAGEHVYPDAPPVVKIGCMKSSEITPGELQVLRYVVQGYTDAAIARELHVSVSAVRYHMTQLFEKTGYTSRVSLIADLINKEFIVPGL